MSFMKTPAVKLFLTLCFFCMLCPDLGAQTVVLSENVKDTLQSEFGRNKKHFLHFFLGYGNVAGKSNKGSEINYDRSGGFSYGLRYKRKINGFCSLGFDVGYRGTNYSISQVPGKMFPDNVLHKSEKLSIKSVELALYNRLNFDINRGNYMGRFLDLGIAYNRHLEIAHVTFDELPNGNEVEVITRKLNYVKYNNFNVFARLGINKYIFTAGYRLLPLFKGSAYNELPRFLVGLELGFY